MTQWARYYGQAQGHFVPTTTIYQDNKSTILLAENGKSSSSKRTRHINVQYFFITDKIKKGEVKVAFCPTMNMLADFFTKPLQGSAFKKMRSIILNMPDTDKSSIEHRSMLVNKNSMGERRDRSRSCSSEEANPKNARQEPK